MSASLHVMYFVISIHSLRGEGDVSMSTHGAPFKISIHSLRGEGDDSQGDGMLEDEPISIHSLRGEGDSGHTQRDSERSYFNPLPPWGGRRSRASLLYGSTVFQSTPSVGRET